MPRPPQRYKYLVADVDDTFTVDGSLHPAVLAAILRARLAGIEVILNTGRPAGYGATLLAYLGGIQAVVVENGGAWIDSRAGLARSETPIQFRVPPDPDLRRQLEQLCERAGRQLGLSFTPTADNAYRLTDFTVVRRLPEDADPVQLLGQLAAAVDRESGGAGSLLASSIHIHFMLDGAAGARRSKADGVAALLRSRGIADPDAQLRASAVAVGDSANDASLFEPGRFALSVGVRNLEKYLGELGANRPARLTREAEGLGLIELIDELLTGSAEELPK